LGGGLWVLGLALTTQPVVKDGMLDDLYDARGASQGDISRA